MSTAQLVCTLGSECRGFDGSTKFQTISGWDSCCSAQFTFLLPGVQDQCVGSIKQMIKDMSNCQFISYCDAGTCGFLSFSWRWPPPLHLPPQEPARSQQGGWGWGITMNNFLTPVVADSFYRTSVIFKFLRPLFFRSLEGSAEGMRPPNPTLVHRFGQLPQTSLALSSSELHWGFDGSIISGVESDGIAGLSLMITAAPPQFIVLSLACNCCQAIMQSIDRALHTFQLQRHCVAIKKLGKKILAKVKCSTVPAADV
ncbi:hypothetical protein L208DRAFT_1377571 [Tricholoma matsutake]|nr:hypothetical protein L208DRAFT_1377571 [Tricholoma matsutake 945]